MKKKWPTNVDELESLSRGNATHLKSVQGAIGNSLDLIERGRFQRAKCDGYLVVREPARKNTENMYRKWCNFRCIPVIIFREQSTSSIVELSGVDSHVRSRQTSVTEHDFLLKLRQAALENMNAYHWVFDESQDAEAFAAMLALL